MYKNPERRKYVRIEKPYEPLNMCNIDWTYSWNQ